MEKTIRIYTDGELTDSQIKNLFWIKAGYLYHGNIEGKIAARGLRILQQWLPVKEDRDYGLIGDFDGAEECFYIDSVLEEARFALIVSLRQIGAIPMGNVRIWSRKLRQEFA